MTRITRTHPASQGAHASEPVTHLDVYCSVPDLKTARSVIADLGRRGIEADSISLLGPAPDEAATQAGTEQADTRMLRYMLKRAVVAGAIGTIVGAAIGALIGLAVRDAEFVLALIVACGAGGGLIATLLTGAYSLQIPRPWELTFHETGRDASWIAVHSQTHFDKQQAEQAIRDLGLTPRTKRGAR
jgi:hypothetical protein